MIRSMISVCVFLSSLAALGMAAHRFASSRVFSEMPAPILACQVTDPGCDRSGVWMPEPADPQITDLLMKNDAIRSIIGNGQLGKDYWLNSSPIKNDAHGDNGAIVDVAFARPISFKGELPLASNPCSGKGNEGHIDAHDPCLAQPRSYGSRAVEFTDVEKVRLLQAQVDLTRRAVVSVSYTDISDHTLGYMISKLSGATSTPATQPPVKPSPEIPSATPVITQTPDMP